MTFRGLVETRSLARGKRHELICIWKERIWTVGGRRLACCLRNYRAIVYIFGAARAATEGLAFLIQNDSINLRSAYPQKSAI
jgi:hypothetical protein